MKNRILTLASVALLVATTTGCGGTLRNFLFGRGASCGLCSGMKSRLLPPANVPAPNSCNPSPCNISGCQSPVDTCETCDPSASSYGPVSSGYPHDPYGGAVIDGGIVGGGIVDGGIIGNGVVYGDSWVPAPVDSQGVRSNYQSYKVDKDGARIINEAPLPPGAVPQAN